MYINFNFDTNKLLTILLFDRYQNELPGKIKSRGKDAHLNHEELCQLMKWKQTVITLIFLCAIIDGEYFTTDNFLF